MTTESRDKVVKYRDASRHYLENALVMLEKGEASKAGELLWGSVAQALQAVAAVRGTRLANHRSLRWFASNVAKELGDRSISNGFWQAEALHSNFHEVELTPEEVASTVDSITEAASRLLALIPEELVESQ